MMSRKTETLDLPEIVGPLGDRTKSAGAANMNVGESINSGSESALGRLADIQDRTRQR